MTETENSSPPPPARQTPIWRTAGRHVLIRLLLAAAVSACPVRGFSQETGSTYGWFSFAPGPEVFGKSPLDLRSLNEPVAGSRGWIAAKGGDFVFPDTDEPVRFWAVNGPPDQLSGEELQRCARRLAKYGVNLIRLHGAVFDKKGAADPEKVRRTQEKIAAMKSAGIYSHLSIYFPLWMQPEADDALLKGYNRKQHPFAALMFNPEFQARYREWWRAILLTPDANGKKLVEDPALFGVEVQNEDSFFFWTFNPDTIPPEQMELLEKKFGDWLKEKYGTLEAAAEKWGRMAVKRDDFAAGRVGFRPLWNIANERQLRDQDTARFLYETQRDFYAGTVAFLRSLGFKGLVTASNWNTASPEVLGPLEKWSYTTGDFIDRHGYFSVSHRGDNSEWSLRDGHTYADRSALRFDNAVPGKPPQFEHPSMDVTYGGKPSMISETTWNRPNRYRSEAPLYYAAYGALQGTDAIVHFALDGAEWSLKPGFFMQPWTLMAPSQMAQFPAAALIYRRGLIKQGGVLATINLNTADLLALKGTPLPQDASFDELRLKDVPQGTEVKPGQRIDPLIHYAGRTEVNFTDGPASTKLTGLKPLVDRAARVVRSSTGELALDYGKGLLKLNAPAAQGAVGNLASAREGVELSEITIRSGLDNAHIVLVTLDNKPVVQSSKMLLQVMSEERATGFATGDEGHGVRKITSTGRDPWQVKRLEGTVTFKSKRPLICQPLDLQGYPKGEAEPLDSSGGLSLRPDVIYYFISTP